MDTFIDPSIPVTLGSGNDQDVALMFLRDDIWYWESDLRAESFDAPYAQQFGVLYRVLNYSAMVPDRYLASLGQVQGTGMKAPVFAS